MLNEILLMEVLVATNLESLSLMEVVVKYYCLYEPTSHSLKF